MKIKTFEARYELLEFCHYIDCNNNNYINVLELLINTTDPEYLEDELSTIFVVETENNVYVYSGYEVQECYETDNGLIKVVCIK